MKLRLSHSIIPPGWMPVPSCPTGAKLWTDLYKEWVKDFKVSSEYKNAERNYRTKSTMK